ncbi:MAG: peptidyl-prolyl cis-trans isomerase [Thermoanaerobaculia bacterium]
MKLRLFCIALCIAALFQPNSAIGASDETDASTLAASLPSSETRTDSPPPIVAVVNGEESYIEDLEREINNIHMSADEQSRSDFSAEELVQRVIDRILLSQEARILEMHRAQAIESTLASFRLRYGVAVLKKKEIEERIEVSEEELHTVFERDYRTATYFMLTVREKQEAERLMVSARDGADFRELAMEHSVDHHRLRGGYQEDISKINIPPDVSAELFVGTPGDLIGPVRTRIGWAILKLEGIKDADGEQYDEVRKRLYSIARYAQTRDFTEELTLQLRHRYAVSIDQDALDEVGYERLRDERLVPSFPDAQGAVASVGDRIVTTEEFAQVLQKRWKDVRNPEAAMAIKPLALEEIIEQHLLETETLERGYTQLPSIQRQSHAYEIELLSDSFLSEVVAPRIQFPEEELRDYYAANRDRFQRPPRVHVGKITVATREEASQIVEWLRAGTDLAWLARRYSTDGFRDKGGDIGWLEPKRNFDPLQDALISSKVGDVLGPFGEIENFQVFQVKAREEQGLYEFEQVAARIEKVLFQQAFATRVDDLIEELRSQADIAVDHKVVSSLMLSGTRSDAQSVSPGHGADVSKNAGIK